MKVRRGDIVYLYDGAYKSTIGAGNLQYGNRPLLVVSNDMGNTHSNICIVAPLTTRHKNNLPTHSLIHTGHSVVLCEQLFTVNQDDVYRIVGRVSKKEMFDVERCLIKSLALERG